MQNVIKKTVFLTSLVTALTLSFSMTTSVFAKGNLEAGKQKSATCVACHQADGNSTTPAWPKIAGQHEDYLIKQIKEIRKGDQGKRPNPAMYAFVEKLTDQDIEDLAAYFTSQKQTPGEAQKSLVEKGRKIYHGGLVDKGIPACAGCHSPNGAGNKLAKFPVISGQQADYLEAQLKAFRAGQRSNDPNEIMRTISAKMSDEEMKAVSSYISGLH
jgi:cytochrome c553